MNLDRAAEVTSCTRWLLRDHRHVGVTAIGTVWSDTRSTPRVKAWFCERAAELFGLDDRAPLLRALDNRIADDAQHARTALLQKRRRHRLHSDIAPEIDRAVVLASVSPNRVFETALVMLQEMVRERSSASVYARKEL
jgi:hypothetical protein